MTRRCTACGTEALPGQRFCANCGQPLAAVAPAGRERRLVSVLFCDLVGFTTFSESRDAEDVRDVLDRYFAAARRVAAGFGGTIEKFIGDAVMILWGAPVAREDDAERAVRAGLALVGAVSDLAERLAIAELRVRVGILTGEASVEVGVQQQGMVIGDAVNTASRIQSIADAGSVFVDDTTRLACERTISFAPGGEHAVKGKTARIRVWRAVAVHETQHGSALVEPPLVGRDEQLQELRRVLQEVLAPAAGVHVLSLIGEAGIGKSRLSREVEERSTRDHRSDATIPLRWHRGRSVAFGEGTGLGALAEIVRRLLGTAGGASAEDQRSLIDTRLMAWFATGDPERERARRAVHRLLDLDQSQEYMAQGELFSAWRALFERMAAEAPLVIVLEELQLADQALFDFIAHLQEWSRGAPILVLLLSRQDGRLVPLKDTGQTIELSPLSDTEIDVLVTATVEGAPTPLLEAIRSEGGGVPLYAVETLRALADRGALAVKGSRYVVRGDTEEIVLPPTIRALVSSRLDQLALPERQLLAAGAILGDTFTAAGAEAVAGLAPGEVPPLLDRLVARAMIAQDGDPRSSTGGRYAFLQGVVRRVALAGLSRRERKRAHLAAFEHISQHPGGGAEQAAVLAGHLLAAEQAGPRDDDAAGIRESARELLRSAAEAAAAVGTPVEALKLFDQAIELARDERERADLLERSGTVAYRAGESNDALRRYDAAEELHRAAARTSDAQRVRAQALRVRSYLRDPAEQLIDVSALDAEVSPQAGVVAALAANLLAFTLYQCGRHDQALSAAARAAEVAEACGEQGELIQALAARAGALQELERPEEAIALQQRAIELAERHEPRRLAALLGNMAVSFGSVGRYADSAERAREAIAAAERVAERFFERWSRLVLARALCSLGEWGQAEAELEAVKEQVPPYYVGMALAPLARIALARGNIERAQALVAEHDARCGGDASSDFRILRSLVLKTCDASAPELAALIEDAKTEDYAEWTGWLAPIVDRLAAAADRDALHVAVRALAQPGAFRQTAPVRAQDRRLRAQLAAQRGRHQEAVTLWREAERFAAGCGMAFEAAAIALECAEHDPAESNVDELHALSATFTRLAAPAWRERAELLAANAPR